MKSELNQHLWNEVNNEHVAHFIEAIVAIVFCGEKKNIELLK